MAYTRPPSVLTISMYAQLVALDLPDVLEAFRHRAVALGLDDRAETLPGDYYEVELPPACFDRVIIANVLHLERPTRARVLISRLAPTLRSGGDLIVVDSFGGGTPTRELAHTIYALNLALRTTGGKAHERSVIESWMEEASLAPAGIIELESWPGTLAAIRANRPGANPAEMRSPPGKQGCHDKHSEHAHHLHCYG